MSLLQRAAETHQDRPLREAFAWWRKCLKTPRQDRDIIRSELQSPSLGRDDSPRSVPLEFLNPVWRPALTVAKAYNILLTLQVIQFRFDELLLADFMDADEAQSAIMHAVVSSLLLHCALTIHRHGTD